VDYLHDAPINTVDFLGEIAGGVDQFAFLQMAHVRQFAEGLQLNRPQCRAKGEEIATGHGLTTAKVMQDARLTSI